MPRDHPGRSWRAACGPAPSRHDGQLGQARRDAGPGQLLGDVPPAGARLQRERNVIAAREPRQPLPQPRPVGRGDLAPLHLPRPGVQIVERDLLGGYQPAYDGHRDLLKLQRGISTPRECLRGQIMTHLSWGGPCSRRP